MSLSKEMLTAINDVINKESEILERKKFTTLNIGAVYIIKKIIFLTTRFGKAIVATLYDRENDVMFQTFLPKRVAETISEDTVELMNKSDGKYTVTYLGQSSNVISGNSKALLNFGFLE